MAELEQRLLKQKLKNLRSNLVETIQNHGNQREVLKAILEVNVDIQSKIQTSNIKEIIQANHSSSDNLSHLLSGLKLLRDYGLELFSVKEDTPYRTYIPKKADSSHAKTLNLLQGAEQVLQKLGYVLEKNGEIRISDDTNPSQDVIATVIADLMIAAEEIDHFSKGTHPNPKSVAPMARNPAAQNKMENNMLYENVKYDRGLDEQSPSRNKSSVHGNSKGSDFQVKKPPVLSPKPSIDLSTRIQQGSINTGNTENDLCDLCGRNKVSVICQICTDNKCLCQGCDSSWHAHMKRKHHERETKMNNDVTQQPRPALRRLNITRIKPSSSDREENHRDSIIIIPGKRSSQTYKEHLSLGVQAKVSQIEKQKISAAEKSSCSGESRQIAKHKVLSRTTAQPENHPYLQLLNDSADEVTQDDIYENVEVPNSDEGAYLIPVSFKTKVPVIPTLVQEFSVESLFDSTGMVTGIEKETDLHKRKLNVENMLLEVDQRLGSISSGMKQATIEERIQVLREQQFLLSYKSDLDSVIQENNEVELLKDPVPGSRIDIQEVTKRFEQQLKLSGRKSQIYSLEKQVIDPPVIDGGSLPRWKPNTHRNGTFNKPDDQASVNASSNANSVRSQLHNVYEPVLSPSHSTRSDPQTLPKPSPKPAVRKTTSEPPRTGSWDLGWTVPWQCEHCTLHNPENTRVCEACNKTSNKPKLLQCANWNRPLPRPPTDAQESSTGSMANNEQTLLKNLYGLQLKYSKLSPNLSEKEHISKLNNVLRNPAQGVNYPSLHQEPCPVTPEEKMNKKDLMDREYEGRKILHALKEADRCSFTIEEFEVALKHHGSDKPVEWLQNEWNKKITQVVSTVTTELKQIHLNAELSKQEARVALVNNDGREVKAIREAVNNWKQTFDELLGNLCNHNVASEKDKLVVVNAMKKSQGDLSAASLELFAKTHSRDMLENIWLHEGSVYGNDEVSGLIGGRMCPYKPYDQVTNKSLALEKRIHILMVEFHIESHEKAHNVIRIADRSDQIPDSASIADIIEAVKNCGNTTRALSYLNQICAVCEEKFPASKIQLLSFCQCKLCIGCLKKYFSLTIKEKQVRDLVCPMCRKPDIKKQEQFELHIQLLTLMLKHHLSHEDIDLFEKKLRDWSLMQDPNFRWCSYDDCGCGFIFNLQQPGNLRMECPECSRITCFQCKKPWEEQHNTLDCEQFEAWQIYSDPNTQLIGVGRLLQDSRIECPKCFSYYAIAKGGCLHFTCTQCGHEFCTGCSKPFFRGIACEHRLPDCQRAGLHCHHPRHCLYYLGNESIHKLQKLLKDHSVSFDTTAPSFTSSGKYNICPVLELKDSNRDEPCARPTQAHYAGLCELHYKEYLVGLINSKNIDPVDMMNLDELKRQFTRVGKSPPSQERGQDTTRYKTKLIQIVKHQIPLSGLSQKRSKSLSS